MSFRTVIQYLKNTFSGCAPFRHPPRIAMLTLCTGNFYRDAMAPGLRSKEEYCRHHGYDLFIGGEEILDTGRPPSWSKIQLIKKYLPNYDYVFFSDADVVIINGAIKLHDLIREHMGHKSFMLTRDAKNNLNMGNFFVKRCSWSFEFMDRLYAQTEFIDHPWWENKAFIHLYESDKNVRKHTRVIMEHNLFNSYLDPADPYNLCRFPSRDFLIHLAGFAWEGYSLEEIAKVMKFCYANRCTGQ
ncbi:MAG: DUF273 domain-containing protein [Kiritimatiellae bacterium]|nr:DUF273 domain-containing protein [Kiritimatiellia bacterium]